jgi:sugar phosphate isomerase/epimerase
MIPKENPLSAPLAVQLYASVAASMATDPGGTLDRLAEAGYVGIEAASSTGTSEAFNAYIENLLKNLYGEELGQLGMAQMAPPLPASELRRLADDNGLQICAAHAQLPDGSEASAILDEQAELGNTLLVTTVLFDEEHGWFETFAELDAIKRAAERFNVAQDNARAYGMRVGYHNHAWEFGASFDGRSGLEVFFDLVDPAVFAEVDIYHAQIAGRDPAELVRSLGDRVQLLHVKDGNGTAEGPSAPVGQGVIDIPGVLAAAPHSQWHVVELEHLGAEVWPAVTESARYLIDGGLSRAHGQESRL